MSDFKHISELLDEILPKIIPPNPKKDEEKEDKPMQTSIKEGVPID